MMRITDRIVSPSRGTSARALSTLNNPAQITRDYIGEVYRVAPSYALDASIVVSQSHVETAGWTSPRFLLNGNPGGLLIEDPSNPDPASWDGTEAAHVHVWALAHACDPTTIPDWDFLPASAAYFVERWTAKYNDPHIPNVVTIDDLNIRYDDAHGEPQATWAWDAEYQDLIVQRSKVLFGDTLPDQEDSPMPNKRPVVVIDAGHRSTDRSGNPAEMAMTDDLAVAYRAELRRRGYEAYWYQDDLDRDSDPDETVGDLNTVAKGLGAWLETQSWALMLSLHYNGAHSPLHAIVPDNLGLSTAYPEGRDPKDTAANNALDRQVGAAIVAHMAVAGLGTPFHGKLGTAGLMSETETGVGLEGFRLAVMAATCPSRLRAVRLVVEHGGTEDPAARRFADFAKAAADAIDAVYGQATPSTTTTAPPIVLVKRTPIVEPAGVVNGTFYQGDRLYQKVQPARLKLIRMAPQYAAPDGKSLASTEPLPKGKVVTMAYVVTGDDGELYRASKAGTYVRATNFTERRE